jgi:hypothetical protein
MDIRDIKGLVPINDYSIYYFSILAVLGALLLFALLFYLYKKLFSKNPKEFYLKELKKIDFEDSKKSAYLITKYAKELVYDEKSNEMFERLNDALAPYKYKKDVENISDDVKSEVKLFIEVVNGSI